MRLIIPPKQPNKKKEGRMEVRYQNNIICLFLIFSLMFREQNKLNAATTAK
jgi:hypothetical protein